jgi:hypothetical protein
VRQARSEETGSDSSLASRSPSATSSTASRYKARPREEGREDGTTREAYEALCAVDAALREALEEAHQRSVHSSTAVPLWKPVGQPDALFLGKS